MFLRARLGLLAALALSACTVRVAESERETSEDAECLELFETCVALAGESAGCNEVFTFCAGGSQGTGTGGAAPGGCEQDYIDCLQAGNGADACQPLLDACTPAGTSTAETTTGCDPDEPGCDSGLDSAPSSAGETSAGCPPDDPSCNGEPSDCDEILDRCQEFGLHRDGSGTCEALANVCEEGGGCDTLLSACDRFGIELAQCEEITRCGSDPTGATPDCSDYIEECEAAEIGPYGCGQINPDQPECFPQQSESCVWYETDCPETFNEWLCIAANETCYTGIFTSPFECDSFINAGCSIAGISDSGCTQMRDACESGFLNEGNCAETLMWVNVIAWTQEFASCNGWK
ncbi:MAG: hypothetical protein AAGA54_36625 [Myxococcota bacterium]